jgi:hypothetical protein
MNINPLLLKTVTKKRLLISKSRGDSNRCIPCRGKSNQHDTYTSHAGPRMLVIHFLRAVPVCGNLPRVIDRIGQSYCSQQKGLPTQSTSRRLIDPCVRTQFLSRANQWSSGESQTSIDNRVLGFSGPYHQHVIVTFNTCSRGSTHRSLIDTAEGYNLGGADFPRSTPRPFQSAVSTFHLRGPSGLQFNQ